MRRICPRCRSETREPARYCALCGLSLQPDAEGRLLPGRVRNPTPAAVPPGMNPVSDAALLYFGWTPSLGGLSGTEALDVRIFNAGYALKNVSFAIRGEGPDGRVVLAREYGIESLPQGAEAPLEIPSYDINEPLRVLRVALTSAEFAPAHDEPGAARGG